MTSRPSDPHLVRADLQRKARRSAESRPVPIRTALEQIRDLLPDGVRSEIFAGELIVYPPPSARHNIAAGNLRTQLEDELGGGKRGNRRQWLFLIGCGVYLPKHLCESDEREYVIPDVAGWRVERAPTDLDEGIFEERPDWVCEVLSKHPKRDRVIKREVYERMGVPFYWMVDAKARWVDVCSLPSTQMYQCERHAYRPTLRAEPFDGFELDLQRVFEVDPE
jgi:Uma2 family endonuclease